MNVYYATTDDTNIQSACNRDQKSKIFIVVDGRHVSKRDRSIVPRNGANVNRGGRLSMAGGYVFRGVSR